MTQLSSREHDFLNAILESAGALVVVLDHEGRIRRFNHTCEILSGYTFAEVEGKFLWDTFLLPEDADTIRRDAFEAFANDPQATTNRFTNYWKGKTGPHHLIEWSCTVLRDKGGNVEYLVCVGTDITEHRNSKDETLKTADHIETLEALKRSEQELKVLNETLEARVQERTAEVRLQARRNEMILNTTSDGFFAADLNGRIHAANPAFCAMLGYIQEEMLTLSIPDIEANESPQDVEAHMAKIFADGHDRFETRHRRKDGSVVDIEITTMLADIGDEKSFYAFARDITARKEAEAELTRAFTEAKRANNAKNEFLSRMSHELRTPMNAILGFAQLLEFEPIGDEPLAFTREIRRAGNHLLELINELLDLSRIESGKLTLVVQPLHYHEIIGDAIQIVQPLLTDNIITLNNLCAPHAMLLADPTRLKQILVNLLSNAAKYNRTEGTIQVDCQVTHEDRLRISVTDTGLGIAAEKLSLLFKPFERLGAEFGEIDGTGIGLALSKQLADLMDGTLGVESTVGKGSTFWLELPLVQAVQEQTDNEAAQQTQKSGHHTVLYIEDNTANLRVIEAIFRRNYQLRLLSATNGEYGLELARRYRPDIILLDIHLPGMDGYAVLAALKADDLTRHIPLIALSADAMPMDIETGLAAGFEHYITKPINIDQFLNTVESCLQ